jgi:proteasome lid subunit RPN8/RPN11
VLHLQGAEKRSDSFFLFIVIRATHAFEVTSKEREALGQKTNSINRKPMLAEINPTTLARVQEICSIAYPQESCGVVAEGEVIVADNLATEPSIDFVLDPKVWARIKKVDFIWHSHTNDSDLSFADIQACKQMGVPMYLFSLPAGGEYYYDPKAIQPLLGRQFIYWAADCWTLVQDWYKLEKDVILTDHPRSLKTAEGIFDWDTPGWDIYREMLPIHFDRHPPDTELERGDLILSTVRWDSPPNAPNTPNHVAIMDDPAKNEILQHFYGRLSERSVYGAEGRRATESVWKFRQGC